MNLQPANRLLQQQLVDEQIRAFNALRQLLLDHERANNNSSSQIGVIADDTISDDTDINVIYCFMGNASTTRYRAFEEATQISLFRRSYNRRGYIRQINYRFNESAEQLLRWINSNFSTNAEESRPRRNKRPSSRLEGYTQERSRGRRRVQNESEVRAQQEDEDSSASAGNEGLQNSSSSESSSSEEEDEPTGPVSLQNHPLYPVMDKFVQTQFKAQYDFCSLCKERRRGKVLNHCKGCKDYRRKHRGVSGLSFENDMDPFYHSNPEAVMEYNNLPSLTDIEEMLIARHLPIMKVYRLKGRDNGNVGFSGNVINVAQNIDELASVLPREISTLPVLIVRRRTGDEADSFRDFQVNKSRLISWLKFLKKWNAAYSDIEINEDVEREGDISSSLRSILTEETDEDDDQGENIDLEEGPLQDDDPERILETGASGVSNQQAEAEAERIRNMVIDWPAQGNQPLDEYQLPYLFTRSFPTLFPYGNGDATYKGRRRIPITLHEAAQHYQSYYDVQNKCYPFARNHRFMFYLHDIDERHRIQSQCSVYMAQTSADANISIADLREMARHNDDFALQKRMVRYASNILGSPAYMSFEKQKLMALLSTNIDTDDSNTRTSSNMATVWWTVSLANYYWEDLHHLLGSAPERDADESDEQYGKRKRAFFKKQYTDNPNVVDEFFCNRVLSFVRHFFGDQGARAVWWWFRYEFQKRGNVHAHGLARLKNDPGLPMLGTKVIKGRKAKQILRIAKDLQMEMGTSDVVYPEDSVVAKNEGDELLNSLETQITERLAENMLTQDQVGQLIHDIECGVAAEKTICDYRDSLLSTVNMDPPVDADKEVRDESTGGVAWDQHACCSCHTKPDGSHGLRPDMYQPLMDQCIRHRHAPTYCLRNGKCRFNFPRPLSPNNKLVMKEVAYQTTEKKGTLRTTKLDFIFHSNDRWLTSHSPLAFLGWGGNMDMSILIDSYAVLEYVSKYCTKLEGSSAAFSTIIKKAIEKRQAREELETKKVIRTMFNLLSKRDKCSQEVNHLVASRPIVHCSHDFISVNLVSEMRRVDVETGEEEAPAVKSTLADTYLKRLAQSEWDGTATKPDDTYLQRLCLASFCREFYLAKGSGKLKQRPDVGKTIPMFSPEFSSNKDGSSYWLYCLVSLWKFKPCVDTWPYKEWVSTRDIERTNVSQEQKQQVIDEWNNYLRELAISDNDADSAMDMLRLPDAMVREIERIRRESNTEPPLHSQRFSISPGYSVDAEDADLTTTFMHMYNDDDNNEDMNWDEDIDWKTPMHTYNDEEFLISRFNNIWADLRRLNPQELAETMEASEHPVTMDMCNEDQKNAVTVWKNICSRSYEEVGGNVDTLSSPNAMIINGVAGTGKSHTIRAMIHASSTIPGNQGKKVLVMAPTGKAALGAGGYTLHSSMGISLPVRGKQLNEDALARRALELQGRFEKISGVIVDEYSMLGLTDLVDMDILLRRATRKNLSFGGLPICFIGDPGQLPPVGAKSLWARRISVNRPLTGKQLQGSVLYRSITNVMKLRIVQRQTDPDTLAFLLALRDGKVTEEQWRWLNDTTSLVAIANRGESHRFDGTSNCIHIYPKNDQVRKHNHTKLKDLNNPINKIAARHDRDSSKSRSSDTCEQLPSVLYLSRDSNIMLLKNVLTVYGLVNGSMGKVKDFVYDENNSSTPSYIIIDFPSYIGPPFFSRDEQKTWVPLPLHKYKWGENSEHYRESFPIILGYALTCWKCQGMTITDPVWVEFGSNEREHGCSYVSLSRVTDFNNLCIGQGVELERLLSIANGEKLKERLLEDVRLNQLYEETKHKFSLT